MKVYVLKEINLLSSGEKGFYVNVYETEEKALKAMARDINEHSENNGAYITYGEIGDWHVELSDENNNDYTFKLESAIVE